MRTKKIIWMLFFFFGCSSAYTRKVDQSIKTRNKDYRACFDKIYKYADHGITDGVKMDFVILPSGEIKNLKVDSTSALGDKLGSCLSKIVAQIHLPTPSEPTRVQYPFVFTKRKSEMDNNY